MPYASGRGLHQINAPLSNLSVKYANDKESFLASKVFPQVPVKKESDAYYIYGRDNMRVPETLRANKAPANEDGYTLSTSTYELEQHSLRDLISQRDRDNADSALSPDVDTMENLTEKILLRKEIQCAATLFTTTSFSNNHSLTSTLKWTALTTTSDPIGDVSTATTVILQNSAKKPNKLIFGHGVMQGLKDHPNIIERIKYSERGIITSEILSAVFDVASIHVGETVQNTGTEGGTDTLAFVWASDAWLGYVDSSTRLKSASAVKTLVKQQNGQFPFAVKKYADQERDGDWIEVNSFFVTKAVASQAAYLIRGVE